MTDILDWLRQYPPEDRDGSTLRGCEQVMAARLAIIEMDYEHHADTPEAMAALREAFEEERVALVDMLARVRSTLAARAQATTP